MKLPPEIRERFREFGRRGGRTRAQRMPPQARSAAARLAVIRRWITDRFGSTSFEELGLPGGDIIDAGLRDLCAGKGTLESLLVSATWTRLNREGVPVPRNTFANPELRLYRLLETSNAELAHARYLAYLRQAVSFADACAIAREDAGHAR